jgi:hypothetical protein
MQVDGLAACGVGAHGTGIGANEAPTNQHQAPPPPSSRRGCLPAAAQAPSATLESDAACAAGARAGTLRAAHAARTRTPRAAPVGGACSSGLARRRPFMACQAAARQSCTGRLQAGRRLLRPSGRGELAAAPPPSKRRCGAGTQIRRRHSPGAAPAVALFVQQLCSKLQPVTARRQHISVDQQCRWRHTCLTEVNLLHALMEGVLCLLGWSRPGGLGGAAHRPSCCCIHGAAEQCTERAAWLVAGSCWGRAGGAGGASAKGQSSAG